MIRPSVGLVGIGDFLFFLRCDGFKFRGGLGKNSRQIKVRRVFGDLAHSCESAG